MAVHSPYFWSNYYLFVFNVLCYHYQLSRIQNLLSLEWSERCDRSSFSGSPVVRMMTQWLAQDCCAPEGAIGLQAGWGEAGGWCWCRHYSSHSCYTVSLSLSLSETQSDVSELQDQRTFCQSLISQFCCYALKSGIQEVSKKIWSIRQTWTRVQWSCVIGGAC